jgi:hypothetical protein
MSLMRLGYKKLGLEPFEPLEEKRDGSRRSLQTISQGSAHAIEERDDGYFFTNTSTNTNR